MSLSIICHLCNENLCNAQIYKEMRVFSFAIYLPFICQMPIIKTCLFLFFSFRPSFGQLWCSVTTKCQHAKLPLATFSLNSCIIQQKLCIFAFVLLSTRHFNCSFFLRITTSKEENEQNYPNTGEAAL